MKETTQILDRLRVVKIDAHIWGGRKKLRKEDLILAAGSELPPEDLASLGSKKIVDPAELAVFHRLKKEAERTCLKAGTRFLGGFAVPEGSIDAIRSELDTIASEFKAARDAFLSRYDQTVEEWIDRHRRFETAIRRAVEPIEAVAAGISFEYVVFRVSHPESTDAGGKADETLNRKVGSLSETLFREIAQEANELVESSLLGREKVTRKALSPLKRIRDKLDGLAFLDHRVQPVVETIDGLLARTPKSGPIEGQFLSELVATALLLSDPEKTKRHGEGLYEAEFAVTPHQNVESASVSVPEDNPPEPENVSPIDLFGDLLDEVDLAPSPEQETVPAMVHEIGLPKPVPEPAMAEDFWF
ncbi:DUF3150 domain-containing protein [Methylocaldum szegediense]|uniref:Cobalamine biosynthesis protein n=1 Tax=Methylocaldum szegediense TaxID=73780 RepID=A0ABM9I0Y9_9GAMM|nr:DUF3150 domain-containing protein [Methylocaldum szegediense]CAI8817847.1 conserved protein of unknown function [Methylocaldum szegediense]